MELELSLKRIFKALDESSFVEVEGFWAQLEALKALDKLQTRAQKAGLSIEIVSAFRPFLYQAKIIEAKFTGERKVLDKMLSVMLSIFLFQKVFDNRKIA